MTNSNPNAGANAQQSYAAEVPTSTPTCCNTHVSGCAVECDECNGTGEVEKNIHRGPEGMQIEMDVMVVCSQCDGFKYCFSNSRKR